MPSEPTSGTYGDGNNIVHNVRTSEPGEMILPTIGEITGGNDVIRDALQRHSQEMAALLGREQAPTLLSTARAAMAANASRPGSQTSEFKMAVMALVAGAVLAGVGLYQSDDELSQRGIELIQWSVAGYAVSRGFTKMGAKASK